MTSSRLLSLSLHADGFPPAHHVLSLLSHAAYWRVWQNLSLTGRISLILVDTSRESDSVSGTGSIPRRRSKARSIPGGRELYRASCQRSESLWERLSSESLNAPQQAEAHTSRSMGSKDCPPQTRATMLQRAAGSPGRRRGANECRDGHRTNLHSIQ